MMDLGTIIGIVLSALTLIVAVIIAWRQFADAKKSEKRAKLEDLSRHFREWHDALVEILGDGDLDRLARFQSKDHFLGQYSILITFFKGFKEYSEVLRKADHFKEVALDTKRIMSEPPHRVGIDNVDQAYNEVQREIIKALAVL